MHGSARKSGGEAVPRCITADKDFDRAVFICDSFIPRIYAPMGARRREGRLLAEIFQSGGATLVVWAINPGYSGKSAS